VLTWPHRRQAAPEGEETPAEPSCSVVRHVSQLAAERSQQVGCHDDPLPCLYSMTRTMVVVVPSPSSPLVCFQPEVSRLLGILCFLIQRLSNPHLQLFCSLPYVSAADHGGRCPTSTLHS